MLVSKNAKICVTPNANPQRKSVEYRLGWVPNTIFFSIFQWNMGFSKTKTHKKNTINGANKSSNLLHIINTNQHEHAFTLSILVHLECIAVEPRDGMDGHIQYIYRTQITNPQPVTLSTSPTILSIQISMSLCSGNTTYIIIIDYLITIFHCDSKPFTLGPCIGSDPQRHNFALRIQTCWYLKTLKFALPQTPNLKFVLPPMQTTNANQWIKGCVGSSTQFLFSIFQWNMGFSKTKTHKKTTLNGGNKSANPRHIINTNQHEHAFTL